MVFLAELKKLFEVELAVAVTVVHAQDCFGQAFRQIVALTRILFKQFLDFAFLQIPVSVRVVLKSTLL